ncbi:hypothetical protein FACS1894187_08700 [Synergistales bacterium]|nr:hypothetical protein FACS1894187_08700 [Synergistales bacterium]
MRKLLVVLLLAVLALGVGGAADAAETTLGINHVTSTILRDFDIDGYSTPLYGDVMFQAVTILFERNSAATDAEKNRDKAGSLTITGGTYTYFNEENKRVDVLNGKVTSVDAKAVAPYDQGAFDIYFNGSETTDAAGNVYTEFTPGFKNASGAITWIEFRRGLSDTGLNGVSYTWTLSGESGSGKFPTYITTAKELETRTPYLEFNGDEGFIFRMATAADTNTAVDMPKARYRVDLYGYEHDTGRNRIKRYDWNTIDALKDVTKVDVVIPAGLDELDKTDEVRVDIRIAGSDDSYAERYRWFFYYANKDQNYPGVTLPASITLKAGEDKDIGPIVLKDGYRTINRNKVFPFVVEDKSVFEAWDWNGDGSGYSSLILRGKKAGTSTLSLVYVDQNAENPNDQTGGYLYTYPYATVTVTVEAPETPKPPTTEPDTTVKIDIKDGKVVGITIETKDGEQIPDKTLFYVWLFLKAAGGTSVRDASEPIGPFIAESVTKDGATTLDMDVNNWKNLDESKAKIDSHEYTLKFAKKTSVDDGDPKYVGTYDEPIALATTSEEGPDTPPSSPSSSGGCSTSVGAAALLLAAGLAFKKRG